jgi:hypothetical protein
VKREPRLRSGHAARFARGVIGLIMDGERPARVPNNLIDELKGREHNGIIALPKKPQPQKIELGRSGWISNCANHCHAARRAHAASSRRLGLWADLAAVGVVIGFIVVVRVL